jgi:outer membrane lipoprotein-sorting protein
MRRYLIAAPLLATLLAGCPQRSQVDTIVAANLAARGGKARIEALGSIRETGTATTSGGRVARIVREIKRPALFRLEFTVDGTTSVFAHDATGSWQIAPLQGQLEPRRMPPGEEATAEVDQLDIEGPLLNWREKGNVVDLVGRVPLAGGEAYKLKIVLKSGAVRFDYVDTTSSQVVRSDIMRRVNGHALALENTFSDFRNVDGLVFPYRVETRVKDRPGAITITVDSIQLNPELDDARFAFPN